ncbi:MAG: hypothetical protein E7J78_26300, partial [Pantoea sp.]|nr:hypothetical protein [Pantoea sp.]
MTAEKSVLRRISRFCKQKNPDPDSIPGQKRVLQFDTYFTPEFPAGHRLLSTTQRRSIDGFTCQLPRDYAIF